VSEGTNRNMAARNTLVQLLAAYTNPESHNAQHHRSYCVAVRSAKNENKTTTKIYKLQKGYIKTQLIAVAKNHPINWN